MLTFNFNPEDQDGDLVPGSDGVTYYINHVESDMSVPGARLNSMIDDLFDHAASFLALNKILERSTRDLENLEEMVRYSNAILDFTIQLPKNVELALTLYDDIKPLLENN